MAKQKHAIIIERRVPGGVLRAVTVETAGDLSKRTDGPRDSSACPPRPSLSPTISFAIHLRRLFYLLGDWTLAHCI
jgi:hypothetical protein